MSSVEEFPSRSFLVCWRAQAASAFGQYISLLALQTLVVVTLHGSATQVGLLNATRWLPYLVVGLIAGALVDRRRRRPIMVVTDLVQAVVLAVIPLLWLMNVLSFPGLLAIVVAYGTASVVHDAAEMSFLPRLVEQEQLQRANARIDSSEAAAMTPDQRWVAHW